jgi:hypothetical protein
MTNEGRPDVPWSTPIPPSSGSAGSASSSSLTSSSSFDPHDISPTSPSTDERRPSALGIRDITKLYRADKKGKARTLELGSAGPIELEGSPGVAKSPPYTADKPFSGRLPEVFAADVHIPGWRIVGGGTWSGEAKVGAYVGELYLTYNTQTRLRDLVYVVEILNRAVRNIVLSKSMLTSRVAQ